MKCFKADFFKFYQKASKFDFWGNWLDTGH